MPQRTTARRYAEAIFQFGIEACADQLALAAELTSEPHVQRVLENPALPLQERLAVIDNALTGRVAEPVRRLVDLLVERGKVDQLPRVAAEYRRLVNGQSGVVTATVTSAVPLTDDQLVKVRQRVHDMTGKTVELQTAIDPDLIGGLTLQVGDQLVDASIRGRLEQLRGQLSSGTRAG